MSSTSRLVATAAATSLLAVACVKVPFTGRSAFNAIPEGTMVQMGATTYEEILAESQVVKGTDNAKTLTRVGNRIAAVADKPDYAWQTNLLADPQVNAWALPGGYIGFYEGILPVLKTEAGMAFVMGHEVGHAVARHAGERMTQQLGIAGALSLLDLGLSGSGSLGEQERGMILGALGIGAQFGVMLPYSRAHEKEADVIGMMYMAKAGYPAKESMRVWERMAQATGGGPPPFLSTHPSSEARIANQQDWMVEARKKYVRNKRDGEDTLAQIW